jgi:hypothetical protein
MGGLFKNIRSEGYVGGGGCPQGGLRTSLLRLALVAFKELFSGSSHVHAAVREWRFNRFAKERRHN